MFSHLLIVILILRYHSGYPFSFHGHGEGFHCKINLTREDEKKRENYIKIEKRTFHSQQKVKIKFILKKHLLY